MRSTHTQAHPSLTHVTHMSFHGPRGVQLGSQVPPYECNSFSDGPWQGSEGSDTHSDSHPSSQHCVPSPIAGRSQPAILGGICVLGVVVGCLAWREGNKGGPPSQDIEPGALAWGPGLGVVWVWKDEQKSRVGGGRGWKGSYSPEDGLRRAV